MTMPSDLIGSVIVCYLNFTFFLVLFKILRRCCIVNPVSSESLSVEHQIVS